MSQLAIIPVRDLPIPKSLHIVVADIRTSTEAIDAAFDTIVGRAALVGFGLLHVKDALGIEKSGRRKKGSTAPPWKELAPLIASRSYDTCREYEKLAKGLIEKDNSLEYLLVQPLHSAPESTQKALLKRIRNLIDGHTLASLALGLGFAKEKEKSTNNNPDGRNGSNNVPLSPEQKQEQLTFDSMSSWLGSTEPTKAKPGSTAFRILTDAGVLPGVDGKPTVPTWKHLPKESLEILQPALAKIAADMTEAIRS